MKPTVHDIARTAGVSLATVDRVLNERPGVRAKTRDRVMDAMNTLGYVRDVGAANLARGKLYQFDFILPDNENTFMLSLRAELQAATERALAERVRVNVVLVPLSMRRHSSRRWTNAPCAGLTALPSWRSIPIPCAKPAPG